jgi:hypothetical protein
MITKKFSTHCFRCCGDARCDHRAGANCVEGERKPPFKLGGASVYSISTGMAPASRRSRFRPASRRRRSSP